MRKKKLSQKRIGRLNDIVDTVNSKLDRGRLRYDILNEIARRHNVSYETIKSDLYALSYAFIERGNVPRTYKSDAKIIRSLSQSGVIDKDKARSAALLFLEHAPWVDKERLARLHGINDPDTIRKMDEIGRYIEGVYKIRLYAWDSHPAKAYAFAWRIIGRKIHQELENARDITEKLQGIAEKLDSGKRLSKKDKKFLSELRIREDDVFDYVDPKRTLRENLIRVYNMVLDHNIEYAKSMWHYEKARERHIFLYNELKRIGQLDKLGRAPPAGAGSIRSPKNLGLADMIENNYKNIRRWNIRPGSKWIGFSKDYKRFAKSFSGEIEKPKGLNKKDYNNDPWVILKKHMLPLGYHLSKGDEIYKEIKEREREDHVLRMIIRKRRQRRGKK